MSNPYQNLEPEAFWSRAVADVAPHGLSNLFQPRFSIDRTMRVATAGSCFAQHIGRTLRGEGFNLLDFEPAPKFMTQATLNRFGLGMYSARYGNIYTARQLLQTFQRALGQLKPVEDVWKTEDGRCFDPFRPNVEPDGFADETRYRKDREWHFTAVRRLLKKADLFIFTFGLTEAWRDRRDGVVFPSCPGAIAGEFDETKHEFVNFSYEETLEDFLRFAELARSVNPAMKFLVTVSPVPLTATASGDHVLPATVYSKSVLRAVCGALRQRCDFVDYFPSYELIASHPIRGAYYEANLRSVAPVGVEQVMKRFLAALSETGGSAEKSSAAMSKWKKRRQKKAQRGASADDVACEEEMLEAFAEK